jgi:protein-tyrosine phosphatase
VTADVGLFEVAFVCTGNRFRSPLAAALLAKATHGLPVRVSSVGVLELGPAAALPEAVELASTLDVDLGGHRARNLSQLVLAPFDLVLGFERMHVQAAVVDASAAIERTFTLPELVAILEELPPEPSGHDALERARARVAQASESRGTGFHGAPVPEVIDPLGRPAREQRAVAAEIDALVRRVAHLLFG